MYTSTASYAQLPTPATEKGKHVFVTVFVIQRGIPPCGLLSARLSACVSVGVVGVVDILQGHVAECRARDVANRPDHTYISTMRGNYSPYSSYAITFLPGGSFLLP